LVEVNKMSLIEQLRQLQDISREECYDEIIKELKAQISKNAFADYYCLRVKFEAKDSIIQRLTNDGLNAKTYACFDGCDGKMSDLRVSIPNKV
jgi:hypothetical protein